MKTTAIAKVETKKLAVPRGYKSLLGRVRGILERGRARARQALEREQVQTWWEVGKEINEDLQKNNGRAKYGERVTFLIARDLEVTPQYIYDISRFQRVFPILKSTLKLTLSHYIILAKIQNSKDRGLLLGQAVKEDWPVSDLRRAIGARRLVLLEGPHLTPESVRRFLPEKRLTLLTEKKIRGG